MTQIRIAAISGSLRANSYNTALLREAARLAPDGITVELVNIDRVPLYNADDEKLRGYPEAVQDIRGRVVAADALLVATPEYNGSVPGVLKNALDWLSRGSDNPLRGMPTAIFGGAGRYGSSGAQRHLRDVLHSVGAVSAPTSLALVRVWDEFDGGRLVSPDTQDRVRRLVEELGAFALRFQESAVRP
jgi:chromate reductase